MDGILSGGIPGVLDPRTAGLLQTGLGMMAASGPSRMPVSFGQALGQAGQQGMQAFQQANQQNMQQQLFGMKLAEAQRAEAERARQQQAMQELVKARPELAPLIGVNPKGVAEALTKQMTENPFSKVDPKDFTQESVAKFSMTKNPADLVPVRKMDMTPAGQVVDLYSAKPGTVYNDPNKPFGMGQDGSAVPNVPYQNYKDRIARSGAPTTKVTVDTGRKPYFQEFGKSLAEADSKLFNEARSSRASLDTLAEARSLIDKGIISGAGAELITSGGQVLDRLGLLGKDTSETISRTQTYAANMGRQVGQVIKQFGSGTGLSDADRQYAEKIAAGKITFNEGALRRLIDIQAKIELATIRRSNKRLDSIKADPVAAGIPGLDDFRVKDDWSDAGGDPGGPKKGAVVDGFVFLGGDPGNRMNWRKQ